MGFKILQRHPIRQEPRHSELEVCCGIQKKRQIWMGKHSVFLKEQRSGYLLQRQPTAKVAVEVS